MDKRKQAQFIMFIFYKKKIIYCLTNVEVLRVFLLYNRNFDKISRPWLISENEI